MAAIFGGYAALLFVEQSLPVDQDDDAILVRASDLEPFMDDYVVQAHAEVIKKVRLPDETVELTYQYQHDDSKRQFDIRCAVFVLPTRGDARDRFKHLDQFGMVEHDQPVRHESVEYPTQGDQSSMYELLVDGTPWGRRFLCRRREKVFFLEMSGYFFEDDYEFSELLDPCVELLESYLP